MAAVGEDGLLVRGDGGLVRMVELSGFNALSGGEDECRRVCEGMRRVAGRLGAGQAVQLVASASVLDVRGLLAGERQRCECGRCRSGCWPGAVCGGDPRARGWQGAGALPAVRGNPRAFGAVGARLSLAGGRRRGAWAAGRGGGVRARGR